MGGVASSLVVKDIFRVMVDEVALGASIPSESVDEEDHHVYEALFVDHPEERVVLVNPRSMTKIKTEKGRSCGLI